MSSIAQPSTPTLGQALDRAAVLSNDLAQLASESEDARLARAATDSLTLAEFLRELSHVLLRFAGLEVEP